MPFMAEGGTIVGTTVEICACDRLMDGDGLDEIISRFDTLFFRYGFRQVIGLEADTVGTRVGVEKTGVVGVVMDSLYFGLVAASGSFGSFITPPAVRTGCGTFDRSMDGGELNEIILCFDTLFFMYGFRQVVCLEEDTIGTRVGVDMTGVVVAVMYSLYFGSVADSG
jgi:hypothetical protein